MSDKAREFRRKWILNPSKEMIDEGEIMQAFADQEVKERIESLTDEVIEDAANEYPKNAQWQVNFARGYELGAKWAREYLKKVRYESN